MLGFDERRQPIASAGRHWHELAHAEKRRVVFAIERHAKSSLTAGAIRARCNFDFYPLGFGQVPPEPRGRLRSFESRVDQAIGHLCGPLETNLAGF